MANVKFSIIDLILKEARVDRWALLQEMQLTNMVNQFAGKNHVRGEDKNPYYEYAADLNDNIIKKQTKIDFKTEKLLLIWLLEQILKKQFKPKEDDEIVKKNLELYFSNRREIDKNIFQIDYNTLKEEVEPWQVGGEERKFLEFISNPIAQGGKLKIYKIEDINTCLKIGPGTSWCIQGEHWAKRYLEKGPLYLVTKNNKRWALLSFPEKMYMDPKDIRLTGEQIKEIRDVWPDAAKLDPADIRWNKTPTKAEQLAAVNKDVDMFQYIESPDREVTKLAIEKSSGNIRYVKNPDKELQMIAIGKDDETARGRPQEVFKHFADSADEEVKKIAVTRMPANIQWIKNPSKELQLIAVKKDGKLLKSFVDQADREVQMAALQNGARLKWIQNPDKAMQIAAITADPDQIEGMQNPDKDIQLAAVTSELSTISYIPNPDKEVQMAAIKKYLEQYPSFLARPGVLLKWVKKWIKNIHPDVMKYLQGK